MVRNTTATDDESTIDFDAIDGKEFRVESKGMSYGTVVGRRADGRVEFERGDKIVSEPVDKVASWVDADYVTIA